MKNHIYIWKNRNVIEINKFNMKNIISIRCILYNIIFLFASTHVMAISQKGNGFNFLEQYVTFTKEPSVLSLFEKGKSIDLYVDEND